MILKKNQIKLFNKIIDFISNKESILLIEGDAGSGKSSTISYTLNKMIGKNFLTKYCIFFLTPTNAAKKVLKNFVYKFIKQNSKNFFKLLKNKQNIHFNTIHSFFKSKQEFTEKGDEYFKLHCKENLIKEYIKKQYEIETDKIIRKFIIIIDECSMLNEKKMKYFQYLIRTYNVKIIFMGDRNQLSFIQKNNEVKDYLSPVFLLKNKFLLKGNIRTNNEKITKIIQRSKKCVVMNKFNFKLYQSDFVINKKIKDFFLYKLKEKHLLKIINDYIGTDFLFANIYLLTFDDIKKHKELLLTDCPKFITYSNKQRDKINNHIRDIIYKNNPYKDDYLFLENEQIIFEKNYNNIFFNTDEFQLTDITYNLTETISFLNLFHKVFTIQTCLIKEDFIYKFKQIKKSEIEIFLLMIKIFKKCIYLFFNHNKLLLKTINTNRICLFCNEQKTEFKKFLQNEYICNKCYFKIKRYIDIKYLEIRSKKRLCNALYQEIQELVNNYIIPVKYSYSITCYKSQGSTYKNVVIDYKNIYMCNKNNIKNLTRSMYVSISRTKEKLFFLDYIKR